MLKGSMNLELYKGPKNTQKNVMTLSILKILGHEIAKSNWSSYNKQAIWTAACIAFFGSFRMGELLCTSKSSFDAASNLTWGDVKVLESSVLVHIKSPKSKNKGGDFVDIFGFKGHNCCPKSAFERFIVMTKKLGLDDKNSAVFKFENGKMLTKNIFNKAISDLLAFSSVKLDARISGHSFRAAIPSLLAKYPDLCKDDHILGWGRWGSKAYLSYTRLKIDQKRSIFEKIVSILSLNE